MKDVTLRECEFGADMVPYMYAELPAAESVAFESHLLECTACTDEFASLSSARYEVYDWKKIEFDTLATPAFTMSLESVAAEPSWIEKLRAAFSGSWALPGAAFAGLVVVSLFAAVFVFSGENGQEIAANSVRSNTAASDVRVQSFPKVGNPIQSEAKDAASPTSSAPAIIPVRATSSKPARRSLAARRVQTNSRSYEFAQATARNGQNKVPRLNEFAEEDDTSLRLAELFEDLDTRN